MKRLDQAKPQRKIVIIEWLPGAKGVGRKWEVNAVPDGYRVSFDDKNYSDDCINSEYTKPLNQFKQVNCMACE